LKEEMMQKISFNFNTLKWEGITVDLVKFWESAFPDCDVIDILTKKMPVWLDANPQKAHKKNFKRFIINWLSRQQDRYKQFRNYQDREDI
jgi:hypothetical protein